MKKLYILFLIISFQITGQVSKGDRTLAWQIDLAQNGNYDSAINYAINGCMESVHLFKTWSDIVPDTNTFDPIEIASFFDVINVYYPAYGLDVELQIAPINTTAKETPSELMGLSFSNPTMIRNFKRFLDTMFAHIPNLKLSALNIGNESDNFWGSNTIPYNDFKIFLDSISPYAKQLYFNLHGEDLKIGTTLTHHGLIDSSTKYLCQYLNTGRDIITTTYYPLNNDFTMKNPSVVFDDFDSLVSTYNDTNQPIYFAECGYSSSSLCNSSEALQAQFYTNVFNAWDSHISNIKHLTIFKSTDWSQSVVDTLKAYYGLNDTIFGEYLRTLGVRTYPGNGTNKLAYEQILCELSQRSWCPVSCDLTDVNQISNEELNIYPNPSTDIIKVDLNNDKRILNTRIISLSGQVIPSKINGNKIDISTLEKGVYLIDFQFSHKTILKKIIKQ